MSLVSLNFYNFQFLQFSFFSFIVTSCFWSHWWSGRIEFGSLQWEALANRKSWEPCPHLFCEVKRKKFDDDENILQMLKSTNSFSWKVKMSKKLHQTRRAESRVHIYFLKKEIEGSFEVSSSIKPSVFWLKMNWAWLQMTDDILKTKFSMELKKLKMEERKLL